MARFTRPRHKGTAVARSRILKPGFFQNEVLAELPYEGRLLFAGLWVLADRDGRLEDRPKRIKAALFPWDDLDVDDLLAGLAERGFITRYQTEAVAVIQIVKFLDHQKPHKRETASQLPDPCEAGQGRTWAMPSRAVSISVSDSVSVLSDSPEAAKPPSVPVVALLEFPTVGDVKAWTLTQPHVTQWQADYPNIDVFAECRKARAWVLADLARRKTARGMEKFLVRWFGRTVERRIPDARRQPDDRRQRGTYQPTEHAAYDQWPAECRALHDGRCGHYQAHQFQMMKDQRVAS